MGERYNTSGTSGRDCPLCFRTGTLTGERADDATLRCTGCATLFTLHRGSSAIMDQLERIPTPAPTRPASFADPARLAEFDRALGDTDYNRGARIADDCFCPGCGARGYQFTCPRCSRAA